MVALMEEARAIGELAKKGQKPKRTIVFCAWDAEEPGLIGSTEWVEDHKKELQEKVVAYINTDGNGRGFLGAGGSHSLQAMVSEVAGSVIDPQTKVSVKERRIAANMVNGGDDSFELYALGSGSDYTPFIQHAGIAALNLGFGGENGGGEYHTIYDTYPHYKRFKDPEFAYGVALANTAGLITLRLANADVLPLNFTQWHSTVSNYLTEIINETESMRKDVIKHNKMVEKNTYQLAADPTKQMKSPSKKDMVPYIDFSPLQNELVILNESITEFEKINTTSLSIKMRNELNKKLMKAEHMLTSEKGLPRRPWFKHQIYAPGFYTGYGVKTLPGVREAIEQKDWKEAQEQIEILTSTFKSFNTFIKEMNASIK
jgi:N-acetylated-alpha-linked acidic dipeptidase